MDWFTEGDYVIIGRKDVSVGKAREVRKGIYSLHERTLTVRREDSRGRGGMALIFSCGGS